LPQQRQTHFAVVALMAAALAFGGPAAEAHAQTSEPAGQIEATPKGTIGLGLVGAEIGLVIPALAGLHETWAFVVFPLVGAAAGAVGGYFAIDNRDSENAAVAMLTTGLALLVPSLVLTLAMTAYDPQDEGELEEEDSALEEIDEGDEPAAAEPEPEAEVRRPAPRVAGAGLLRYGPRGLQLGLPGVGVVPTYTQEELRRYGGTQQREVRVSLFSGAF